MAIWFIHFVARRYMVDYIFVTPEWQYSPFHPQHAASHTHAPKWISSLSSAKVMCLHECESERVLLHVFFFLFVYLFVCILRINFLSVHFSVCQWFDVIPWNRLCKQCVANKQHTHITTIRTVSVVVPIDVVTRIWCASDEYMRNWDVKLSKNMLQTKFHRKKANIFTSKQKKKRELNLRSISCVWMWGESLSRTLFFFSLLSLST